MLITSHFVILNLPKTGSSFVRQVVKAIYKRRARRNPMNRILVTLKMKSEGYKEILTAHPYIPDYRDQHGCFDQIPEADRCKQIVSVIRDPYARMESLYRFGWWQQHPPLDRSIIEKYFPGFPDLTFNQFLEMNGLASGELKKRYEIRQDVKIGVQTIQFIRFFFKNHLSILKNLSDEYIAEGHFKKDICNVQFLRNEHLNDELAAFLSGYGITIDELHFIKNHEKVNITPEKLAVCCGEDDLTNHVNEHEWMLFEILSSFGINYKRE